MSGQQYVYHMRGLTKSFQSGKTVLRDISLNFLPGAKIGVLGPNGAGKTTIFNLITGIYNPSEGNINLEGKRINGLAPHDRGSVSRRKRRSLGLLANTSSNRL